jgi:hypothetical protein
VPRSTIAPPSILIALAALTGCAMFHHGDTPQQQFMSALQRGNGPQASQIWLNMNADDRANLAHGKGLKPLTSPDEIKAKLTEQEQAEADTNNGGIETGDIDSQRIELPAIDTNSSAGLQSLTNLPSTIDSSPSSPANDAP